MDLKIISDGTPSGTIVVNKETGEQLRGVVAIDWSVKPPEGVGPHEVRCWLELENVPLEVEAHHIKTYQMRTCHAE